MCCALRCGSFHRVTADSDPPPAAPQKPAAADCCGGGCEPCIFEIYAEELARYQEALKAWQERAAERARSG